MRFAVYILQSETTGRYYIGQTQSLRARVAYHQANYSKALKNRGPSKLVHVEEFAIRREAILREQYKRQKDRGFIERSVARPGETGKVEGSNPFGCTKFPRVSVVS